MTKEQLELSVKDNTKMIIELKSMVNSLKEELESHKVKCAARYRKLTPA